MKALQAQQCFKWGERQAGSCRIQQRQGRRSQPDVCGLRSVCPSKKSVPTKEKLLEMMKKANISIEDLKEDSAPILHDKSRGKIIDEDFSESSTSDSSSSSGTSESVESVVRHAAGSG